MSTPQGPTFSNSATEATGERRKRVSPKERALLERIAELEAENRQLRVQAFYDRLTGLSNRQGGEIISLRMIEDACRDQGKLGVVMFDLDNFKAVNDILGHEDGDVALKTVARIARENMRVRQHAEDHHAIRQGGDEHVFLINNPRDKGAVTIFAERLRTKIEKALQPLTDELNRKVAERLRDGKEVPTVVRERYEAGVLKVGASFGAVLFEPAALKDFRQRFDEDRLKATRRADADEPKPAEKILMDLLKRADEALYKSKAAGRNRTTVDPIGPRDLRELPISVRAVIGEAAPLPRRTPDERPGSHRRPAGTRKETPQSRRAQL